MAVYRLIDKQQVANWPKTTLNVYFYQNSVDTPNAVTAQALADSFESVALPTIRLVQGNGVGHFELIVDIIETGLNLVSVISPIILGNETGSVLPPWNAAAFRLNRTTRATRHGQKRLNGIPETFIDGVGQVIDSGYQTRLNNVAGVIGAAIGNFTPCIVTWNGEFGAPPAAVNLVQNATFTRITTQNSRKVYQQQ